jgi:tetratricopeptide (TPR) repeat protein
MAQALNEDRTTATAGMRLMSRHGIALGILSLGLATGCSQLGPAEKASLAEANRAYGRGDVAGACTRLDRLIGDFDGAMEIGEAYYLRGLCRTKNRQYGLAVKDFEAAAKKSKRDDLTQNARISLASLAFQRGDWDQAVDYYDDVLSKMPAAPPKDEVLYAAGLAMQRVGKWKEASICFSQILNKFRHRPIAADARRKASWPHPYFAIQLGAFRDSANATNLVQSCRNRNIDASQESLSLQGQAMWVVMTGRYRTYAEAMDGLTQVKKWQANAVIVP